MTLLEMQRIARLPLTPRGRKLATDRLALSVMQSLHAEGYLVSFEQSKQSLHRTLGGDMSDYNLYGIDAQHLLALRAVAKRLFSEERMNGDEMRNAAQTIMAVVEYAEKLGPIPE